MAGSVSTFYILLNWSDKIVKIVIHQAHPPVDSFKDETWVKMSKIINFQIIISGIPRANEGVKNSLKYSIGNAKRMKK